MKAVGFLILTLSITTLVSCKPCQQCYAEERDKCDDCERPLKFSTLLLSVGINSCSELEQSQHAEPQRTYDSVLEILENSQKQRESNPTAQSSHRVVSVGNIPSFKKWYDGKDIQTQRKIQTVVRSQYCYLLPGSMKSRGSQLKHYERILDEYQFEMEFLSQLGTRSRVTKVALRSVTNSHLALLSHIGIEGVIATQELSELQNTQNLNELSFASAESANLLSYGAVPVVSTFRSPSERPLMSLIKDPAEKGEVCSRNQEFILALRNKTLNPTSPYMFQSLEFAGQFPGTNDFSVIEAAMEQFSMEKKGRLISLYANPEQFFANAISRGGFSEIRGFSHSQHSKQMNNEISEADSFFENQNSILRTINYMSAMLLIEESFNSLHSNRIQRLTKKLHFYQITDQREESPQELQNEIVDTILSPFFDEVFPLSSSSQAFYCQSNVLCKLPDLFIHGNIFLRVFNPLSSFSRVLTIELGSDKYAFEAANGYSSYTYCLCEEPGCSHCFIEVVLPDFSSFHLVQLKTTTRSKIKYASKTLSSDLEQILSIKDSRTLEILHQGKTYRLGYHAKEIAPQQSELPKKLSFSNILSLQLPQKWMLTMQVPSESLSLVFAINKKAQEARSISISTVFKDESLEALSLKNEYFLMVESQIDSQGSFYTDSNGWLVSKSTGNHSWVTSFAYIEDSESKLSINADRPSQVSSSDGKLQFKVIRPAFTPPEKQTYGSEKSEDSVEYSLFGEPASRKAVSHMVNLGQKSQSSLERNEQLKLEMPLIVEGNLLSPNQRIQEFIPDRLETKKWIERANPNNTKVTVHPDYDSDTRSILLKVHNLRDYSTSKVELFASDVCTLLSAVFSTVVRFQTIEEASLTGRTSYTQFVEQKWSPNLRDANLNKQLQKHNEIFTKEFQESVELKPLEIRAFKITGVEFERQKCQIPIAAPKDDSSPNRRIYTLDFQKSVPVENSVIRGEKEIQDYFLNVNHCNVQSPVSMKVRNEVIDDQSTKITDQSGNDATVQSDFVPKQSQIRSEQQEADQNGMPEGQGRSFEDILMKVRRNQRLNPRQKQEYFKARLQQIEAK